jgi:putative peptidoglycan lipid II flippase
MDVTRKTMTAEDDRTKTRSEDPQLDSSRKPSAIPVGQNLRERWQRLTSGSANRRIFGATLLIGVLTFGIKIISLLKESVVAASFGTGRSFDAFIVALLLPMTVVSIISGSLNAALIPTYIEVREKEDTQAAHRLYTTVLMLNTLLLVGLAAIMAATAHLWLPFLASGFDKETLTLARTLLYGSLPIIVIAGFSTTWGALLNAGERFALVAIAPALQPLAIILMLGVCLSSLGIEALLLGTLLGTALEAALVGAALTRQGHPLLPRWHGVTPAFRKVFAQYGACIAGMFLVSGMSLVDQAMASQLGPRSNSALDYGSKLVALILSLGAASLGTAILPQLSRMVAFQDWAGIRHFLKFYSKLILGITVPLTIILILISKPLIRTLYQHGSFTSADTDLVTKVQIFYLLRIPISTIGVLVTRTLTALKANQILTMVAAVSFVLNIFFNFIFMKQFGVAGITLSTSAWCSITLICLGLSLHFMLKNKSTAEVS